MEDITLNLKNMNIVHYEVGNSNKQVQRPVCALMLTDDNSTYKVKALFKGETAKRVQAYMATRRTLGNISSEKVFLVGRLRELRKDCVVVDDTNDIWFDIAVGV